MKQRQLGVRQGPSFKVRRGKNGHVRKGRAERCKLSAAAAASVAERPEPSTSREAREQNPAHTALLVEEGMSVTVLPPGQKLTFIGKCVLTCLYGCVEVLGLTINSSENSYELFSPKTHAPLTIEGRKQKREPKTRKEIRMEARSILREYLSLDCRRAVMNMFKSSYSILLLERLEDAASCYILSHLDYAKIYGKHLKRKPSSKSNEAVLNSIGIQSCDPATGVSMSQEAVSAAQQLVHACLEEHQGCPIILVCGPQNVGKSTFNRFLINQLLSRIPCVGYLDCDLGQTEFTPPGCISLLSVDEPILGPPYSHQRNPDKMVYFGETSCEQEIDRFIESVKYVFTSYKRDQPLIINTMGWVKGFGLLLLIDLIHLLSPTHIVQMRAVDGYVMEPLTPEFVKNSPGFVTKGQTQAQRHNRGQDLSDDEDADNMDGFHFRASEGHQLITIESDFLKAGDGENMLCHNWILRDIAMLGYISEMQPFELEHIIPLNSLLPYEVPFNSVALRVIHADVAPSHIMYTANASWVGLCHIMDDVRSQDSGPVILTQTPICDCLGFGIVRGINMAQKVYHILTPVSPEVLPEVNCLLIGNISIPHSIFKNQPGIKGDVPYVTSEYDFSIYGSGKLRLKKNLKRREHL